MKKFIAILCLVAVSTQFASCKSEAKKEPIKEVKAEKIYAYSLKKSKNDVNFVAYKTTDKVPVKGMFKTVKITGAGEGDSIKEAINGAEFSIPVGSIETNDSGRNVKIQNFFFGVMTKSKVLKGKLMLEDDTKGFAEFTMNGITEKLPFEYTIEGNSFKMNAIMNIDKWNAQAAIASLNEVCKALHAGADGVSKTWSEVAINIVSTF